MNEYQKYFEKDKALERRFQKVMIEEPGIEDAISILRGLKDRYETHHHVRIKDEAIIAAVELSNRYITDRFLPDNAGRVGYTRKTNSSTGNRARSH